MPANTAKGYPYPLGTDRLMDGDDAIKNLADAVNVKLGVAASGFFTAADAASAGAVQTTAVTYPVGRFTSPPGVVAQQATTNPTNIFVASYASTTAGFSCRSLRTASVSGVPIYWIAIQPD
jgi:hypothetical protein